MRSRARLTCRSRSCGGPRCSAVTCASTARLALTDGVDALAAVRLELLRPIQPMLASTAEDVTAALEATGPASVEWKLDGARIQVHRRDDEVQVYTRNLNEVTDRLPEVVAAVRTFPARTLVLDGEAIGLERRRTSPSLPGHDEPLRTAAGRRARHPAHGVLLRRACASTTATCSTNRLRARLDALGRASPASARSRRCAPTIPAPPRRCSRQRSPPATKASWSRR